METVVGKQFSLTLCCDSGILNAGYHLTWVIEANNGTACNSCVITTTIGIVDGTTQQLKVCLAHLRLHHILVGSAVNRHIILATGSTCSVGVCTITTTKELTNEDFLCISCFHITIHLGRDSHKDVPCVVDGIVLFLLLLTHFVSNEFCQFSRNGF